MPQGSGQHVLVGEDNLEVGRFCTLILQDLGYTTIWTVNAEVALEKLGSDDTGFDVVFSDVVMPGMDGVALAETFQKIMPKMTVILALVIATFSPATTITGSSCCTSPTRPSNLRILQGAAIDQGLVTGAFILSAAPMTSQQGSVITA